MVFLNLDKDGRVLSAQKMPETPVAVNELPDGDISEYKYFDLAFLRDPLPAPVVKAELSQLDKIEAQVTYTAMITDTMLDESEA